MTLDAKMRFFALKPSLSSAVEEVEIGTYQNLANYTFFVYQNGSAENKSRIKIKSDEGLCFGWQLHAIKYLLLYIFLCLWLTYYVKESFLSFKVRANFLKVLGCRWGRSPSTRSSPSDFFTLANTSHLLSSTCGQIYTANRNVQIVW